MVGDSVNDVQAARAAGIPVVCVSYGYNEGRDPRTLDCDSLLDSLAVHGLQLLEDVIRHAHGQIDKTVVLADIDMTDVTPIHAGLVRDGADDVPGQCAMCLSDLDAEGLQGR